MIIAIVAIVLKKKYKESYLGEADITDSPDTHQGYIDEKRRREKWGDDFEEYEKKKGTKKQKNTKRN